MDKNTADKYINKRAEFQDEFNECYGLIADLTDERDTLLQDNKELREWAKRVDDHSCRISSLCPACEEMDNGKWLFEKESTLIHNINFKKFQKKTKHLLSNHPEIPDSSKERSDWYDIHDGFDLFGLGVDWEENNQHNKYRIKLDGVRVIEYTHVSRDCYYPCNDKRSIAKEHVIGQDPYNKIIIVRDDSGLQNKSNKEVMKNISMDESEDGKFTG
jgi:hypothetical protein